jgi:tRNA-dihydrouridine synthase
MASHIWHLWTLVVIFQIGSSDPELAVQAAKVVQQDVAGL